MGDSNLILILTINGMTLNIVPTRVGLFAAEMGTMVPGF